MKANKREYFTCILFCGFLAGMALLYGLMPRRAFSETEKRYLADAPEFRWSTLSSGQFGRDMETYMADHIPGRDFFVGVNAYADLLTGRQVAADIYAARDHRLVEAPVQPDAPRAERNMAAINSFAGSTGLPVDFMLVPSAGWAAQADILGPAKPYEDAQLIADVYAQAGPGVQTYDLMGRFAQFENPSALYYRTDHHWTSRGAYEGYRFYMESLGRKALPQEHFRITVHPGFRGSTYSRSALWLTPAETIELWEGSPITVENGETPGLHQGPFYPERLEESDMYTVFLDGNHSTVRLHNPQGEGSLLVIRDSYTNCLGSFLAESYENVILADLRYYKDPISQLCLEENIDRVLVLYSLSNFMTDANIVWLQ